MNELLLTYFIDMNVKDMHILMVMSESFLT